VNFGPWSTWSAAARIDEQQSQSYATAGKELDDALAAARRADLDPALAEAFLTQGCTVPTDAQAADRLALDIDQLKTQTNADERLALRGDLLARARDIASRSKFREDNLAGQLQAPEGQLDKNRA